MSTELSEALDVGKKLVELCNAGKHLEAIDTLYSDNIVSIEPCDMPDMPAKQEGIEAVRAKNQWWLENHEIHSGSMAGPFPHGNQFIVFGKSDATAKAGPMAGQRFQMEEASLYTVENGKIVKEEFFYNMGDS